MSNCSNTYSAARLKTLYEELDTQISKFKNLRSLEFHICSDGYEHAEDAFQAITNNGKLEVNFSNSMDYSISKANNIKHINILPTLKCQSIMNLIKHNTSLHMLRNFPVHKLSELLTTIGELLNTRHACEQPPTNADDEGSFSWKSGIQKI